MIPRFSHLCLYITFFLVLACPDAILSRANPKKSKARKNEISVWSGLSLDSPGGRFLGLIEDRKFYVFGLRYGRIFTANKLVALEYTVDIIPLAVVTDNPQDKLNVRFSNLPRTSLVQTDETENVYGAGFSPIGLKLYIIAKDGLRVFLNGSGGFLTFVEDVPVPESRKFNFTFEFGGGLQVMTNDHWGANIGYKFHHLSNAQTGRENPGLDANIFYFELSFFK